ncbi:hypothetical protein BH11PSE12_BH11PSE12_09710 [soil metagenome]
MFLIHQLLDLLDLLDLLNKLKKLHYAGMNLAPDNYRHEQFIQKL